MLRNTKDGFSDLAMVVACGLHNWRVRKRVRPLRRWPQKLFRITSIVNDKAGHDVPTVSPLRNILLVVAAKDDQGNALALRNGSTLPEWAGDYAGRPGKGFAKILEELWTEVSPSAAYWRQTRILSDNRIPAFGADTSHYIFAAPTSGKSTIEVNLIYRRAFYPLMQQKGWQVPDILMSSTAWTSP